MKPLSPHLQVYRPQLTSVLSFAHRLSGIALGIYAVALVVCLVAAAAGPQAYSPVQNTMQSWPGRTLVLIGSFFFFLHLCGGIRHLFWDAGRGFELRTIYASGWAVVATSISLTVAAWVVSVYFGSS